MFPLMHSLNFMKNLCYAENETGFEIQESMYKMRMFFFSIIMFLCQLLFIIVIYDVQKFNSVFIKYEKYKFESNKHTKLALAFKKYKLCGISTKHDLNLLY